MKAFALLLGGLTLATGSAMAAQQEAPAATPAVPATPAEPATPATPADPSTGTAAVPATPATPAVPATPATAPAQDSGQDALGPDAEPEKVTKKAKKPR